MAVSKSRDKTFVMTNTCLSLHCGWIVAVSKSRDKTFVMTNTCLSRHKNIWSCQRGLCLDKRFVATETVFVAAHANCVIQHQPCPPYVSSLPVHIETYQFDQLFANLPIATTNPLSLSFLLSVHTVFPRSWFR